MIDSHIIPAFGKDDPRAITRNRIELWHGGMAQRTPIEANRALAVLSSFLTWLEHDHNIDRNPCRGIRRRPENQRQVFLDADEIAAAHAALSGDNNRTAALALRLALLTGCRIGETLTLTAEQIDTSAQDLGQAGRDHQAEKTAHRAAAAEALAVAQELLGVGLPDYEACSAPGTRKEDHRPRRTSASTTCDTAGPARWPAAALTDADRQSAGPHRAADDGALRSSG